MSKPAFIEWLQTWGDGRAVVSCLFSPPFECLLFECCFI